MHVMQHMLSQRGRIPVIYPWQLLTDASICFVWLCMPYKTRKTVSFLVRGGRQQEVTLSALLGCSALAAAITLLHLSLTFAPAH
jgi:hypothetical protein